MNAVGIDVSKNKSTIAILRPFGEIVARPFDVKHTAPDIKHLIAQLKALDGDTKIVMEHTTGRIRDLHPLERAPAGRT
ncbi:hypothetical protein HNQ56_000611 [Anaerotaenia torta]